MSRIHEEKASFTRTEGRWLGMQEQPRRKVFPLRFWLICAVLIVAIFIPIFRGQDSDAVKEQQALAEKQQVKYETEMLEQKLRDQIERAKTEDFKAQEARRRYGYAPDGTLRFLVEEPLPPETAEAFVEAQPAQGVAASAGEGAPAQASQDPLATPAPTGGGWESFH